MQKQFNRGESVYTQMPSDLCAEFFTAERYGIVSDGSCDVSDALQSAINKVAQRYGYGIVYVPTGIYLLSKTIYIPKAIRVIGYGDERPLFVLRDNAPYFNMAHEEDKGGYKYLFWFVDTIVSNELEVSDANPGTFYSCLSNVDICMGDGNNYAVALRTHYAQHSFVSHININVMSGMAGIYDVGNEMEDISIYGGQYAIITTKCSPGWPFMMVDTYFEGQKKAAIKTREAGLTIVRNKTVNTPVLIDVDEGHYEKIYIEDSVAENITDCLFNVALDKNSLTQVNAKRVLCKNVSCVAKYKDSGRNVQIDRMCTVEYVHGTVISDDDSFRKIVDDIIIGDVEPEEIILESDIKPLPNMNEWTDVTKHGIVGDGQTDNTEVMRGLLEKFKVLYFPQGEYLFTDQIMLKKDTNIIGMHPFGTRLILKENSENYNGPGNFKGFVVAPKEGENILNGVGIDTGGRNPRAAAVVWSAGKDSYVNDVKLIGGHGNLVKGTGAFDSPYNESRSWDKHPERVWDGQFSSFLVLEGGGTFKDIWTASTYATSGFEVRNSKIKSKVYCLSLEHHQRNELVMINSSDWHFYAIQTEEEYAEGVYAVPYEIRNCTDITFNTAYFFRVVWVNTPLDYCVKCYDSKNIVFNNINNMSQMKYTITGFAKNYRNNSEVRLWQAAKVFIDSKMPEYNVVYDETEVDNEKVKIDAEYKGFRFADSGVTDSKGNFYFIDSLDKRVYKIDYNTSALSVVFESPIKINSICFDTEENLIYIAEYIIPKEATENGELLTNELPPDSFGTSYGYWYNSMAYTFAFTVNNGNIEMLEQVDMCSVKPKLVYYPGNRMRDASDFTNVVQYKTEKAFMAKDGKTIIPYYYDLIRCNTLVKGVPGEKMYCMDEFYKRVYSCEVTSEGLLKNPNVIAEQGDFCVVKNQDELYVCDDNIKIYDLNGNIKKIYTVPERVTTIGVVENKLKYVTTRHSVYVLK